MGKEIWKEVPGWGQFYQASSFGRVRSKDRTYQVKYSRLKKPISVKYKGRVLAQRGSTKYPLVALSSPQTGPTTCYVHQIVALTFLGKIPKGLECCHNDGNSFNNHPENLRYDTRSNNALDRHRHGTMGDHRGEKANSSKLNRTKVKLIRKLADRHSFRALGRQFKVCHGTISDVVNRRSWLC